MATRIALHSLGVALLIAAPFAEAERAPPVAYRTAAHAAHVPANLLFAVALQESGIVWRGRLLPWPWSLNIEGVAFRYATRAQACAALKRALKTTATTRIDAGLGQLNVGYQGHRVERPCDLLDPYRNLELAATILREHYEVDDDWLTAVAHYHHPAGGELAGRYRESVAQHLARLRATSVDDSIRQEQRP